MRFVFCLLAALFGAASLHAQSSSADTIFFRKEFPAKPHVFRVNNRFLAVLDAAGGGLFYHDRTSPPDSGWRVIDPIALRRSVLEAYLPGADVDSMLRHVDREVPLTQQVAFGGGILGLDLRDSTIHFAAQTRYLEGESLSNILSTFQYEADGRFYGPWIYRPDTSLTATMRRLHRELMPKDGDDMAKMQEAGRKINEALRQWRLDHPNDYGPSGDFLFAGRGRYVFTILANDSASYRMAALYRRDTAEIKPVALLPARKGPVYATWNLEHNMSGFVGEYPLVMMPISAELYNLQSGRVWKLPLIAGTGDYALASILSGAAKRGLFVLDVTPTGEGQTVKVLYSTDGANLRVLHYDYGAEKTVSDVPLRDRRGDVFVAEGAHYQFDGGGAVMTLLPSCRCAVRYPID